MCQEDVTLNQCWCSLFRDTYEEANKFTERDWSRLVEAVEQRNSAEDMSQLKLVGEPTVNSKEESEELGSGLVNQTRNLDQTENLD